MLTGLPGFWILVYPAALALIGASAFAIYDREGSTVLKRTDTRHGYEWRQKQPVSLTAKPASSVAEPPLCAAATPAGISAIQPA